MICELRIRGIGVIDDAVIEFSPGFTVVTGETGAGKTMVLTGLDLLRGVKADAGDVRTGASRAEVDGVWKVSADFAQARGSSWADVGVEDIDATCCIKCPTPRRAHYLISRSPYPACSYGRFSRGMLSVE